MSDTFDVLIKAAIRRGFEIARANAKISGAHCCGSYGADFDWDEAERTLEREIAGLDGKEPEPELHPHVFVWVSGAKTGLRTRCVACGVDGEIAKHRSSYVCPGR